jgi:hypothetical protein
MFDSISNESSVFYFKTTLNAPKRKIVKYDIERPQLGFVDVIPESINVLEDVTLVDHNKLILIYLQDVKVLIYISVIYLVACHQCARLIYWKLTSKRRTITIACGSHCSIPLRKEGFVRNLLFLSIVHFSLDHLSS